MTTYGPRFDPAFPGDMACTGFPNGIGSLSWLNCCIAHDLGSTDWELFTCVASVTPDYLDWLVGLAVLLMITFRPVYNWMQRRGWVK